MTEDEKAAMNANAPAILKRSKFLASEFIGGESTNPIKRRTLCSNVAESTVIRPDIVE